MNDEELTGLFASFDEVSATDSLKAATLERIFAVSATAATAATAATEATAATADASAMASADTAELQAATQVTMQRATELIAPIPAAETVAETASVTAETAKMPQVAVASTVQKQNTPAFTATRGKDKVLKAKFRAIRVAAVAACFVLALSGGVAYAVVPASYVTISQGGTTIELGVSRLGFAVTATANDEAGEELIAALNREGGLLGLGVSVEQSVEKLTESLRSSNPNEPIVRSESDEKAHVGAGQGQDAGSPIHDGGSGAVPVATSSDGAGQVAVPTSGEGAGAQQPVATPQPVAQQPVIPFEPEGVVGIDEGNLPAPDVDDEHGGTFSDPGVDVDPDNPDPIADDGDFDPEGEIGVDDQSAVSAAAAAADADVNEEAAGNEVE